MFFLDKNYLEQLNYVLLVENVKYAKYHQQVNGEKDQMEKVSKSIKTLKIILELNSHVLLLASLCNACGLRYKWILEKEKKIEPKNTTPVNISSLLNPTQSPRSSPMKPIRIPVVLDRNSPLPLSFEVPMFYCVKQFFKCFSN